MDSDAAIMKVKLDVAKSPGFKALMNAYRKDEKRIAKLEARIAKLESHAKSTQVRKLNQETP